MTRARIIAKRLGWALAAVLVFLALVFAFLQTGPGLAVLERGFETILSSEEQRFQIDGLKGRVPDRLKIDQFTISDAAGPWLSAQDISLAWKPLSLLGGLLHVEQLAAANLSVVRLPDSDRVPPKADSAGLSVPRLPFGLRVDLLGIEDIGLQTGVIGTPARLSLTGSVSTEAEETIRSALEIERTDGPLGSVSLKSSYTLTDRTLNLDVQLREPADGLIGQILGIAGLPEFDLSVTGRGPVTDWRGRLAAKSGTIASVDADLRLAAGDTVEITVGGNADLGAFAPAAYRDLLNPAVSFSANGAWDTSNGTIRIAGARFANDAFDISAAGQLSGQAMNVDAKVSAVVAGARLAPLTAPMGTEKIELALDLSGPLAALEIRFSADGRKLALDPVSVDHVSVIGSVSARKSADTNGSVLGVVATIETEGFAAGMPALTGLLGAQPHAFMAGDIDLARGLFTANDLRINGVALRVAAQGTGSLDGATMDLTLETVVDDLARLPVGSSVALKGNGSVTAEIKAQGGAVAATVRGRAANFATGIGVLDNLLGAQFDLVATAVGAPGMPWQVSDLALDAKNASVRGDVSMSADFDTIDVRYTANVPNLGPLAADLGVDVAGRIDSKGTISGGFDDLAFTGGLDGTDLTIDGQVLPRASVLLDAKNLTNEPRGSFALDAHYAGAPVTARGDFGLGATALRLSSIEVEGPGLRAAGDVTIPTDGGAIEGTVRADALDLKMLSAVFGQSASGHATANFVFGQTDGQPVLHAELDASELIVESDGERFSAGLTSAKASVAYSSEDLGFTSSLKASGVSASMGTLSSLDVTAGGTAREIKYRVNATGDINGETDFALEGALTRPAEGTIVSVSKLVGQLAGQTVALITPARLQIGANDLRLDPLQLNFAGGEIRAQGALDDVAVSGDIEFQGLPVSLLAVAGVVVPIEGSLDGTLNLRGSPARPEANLSAVGRGLQFQLDGKSPSVPIELSLTASLRDDQITFETVGAGGDFFSLTSRGQGPLRFAVRPFTVALDPDGGISGELEFAGNVAVIGKMVALDPHRIRGTLRARAAIAGTVAKPIVTGNATLADGGYENIEIGTLLENVDATIEFVDGRANVRATALDGGTGRVDLKGHVALAQPQSLDLALRMENVTLVRRDEVVAALSGDIFASGGFGDLLVSGQVETNIIEVRLIDALPPEVVSLKVEEIGFRRSGTPAPPLDSKDLFSARLEIGVAIPRQLFVRGRGLDSEWQGNLRVFGTTEDAEVTGSLSAVRGQFSFAGKTFKLAKGVIDIDERDGAFAAILDVQTEYTDDDFVARVNVTGPATKPEIALTSTPELPRDEVLSRILFGRGTGQLSPVEALQLAEAAASLSGVGGASTGVLDKVRSILGVDVLQVNAGEGDSGPTVRAGKYVADGVFIGAKQGAGPGASAATVEIELTPHISLESEVGQTGRSRAGVNWQFNY